MLQSKCNVPASNPCYSHNLCRLQEMSAPRIVRASRSWQQCCTGNDRETHQVETVLDGLSIHPCQTPCVLEGCLPDLHCGQGLTQQVCKFESMPPLMAEHNHFQHCRTLKILETHLCPVCNFFPGLVQHLQHRKSSGFARLALTLMCTLYGIPDDPPLFSPDHWLSAFQLSRPGCRW